MADSKLPTKRRVEEEDATEVNTFMGAPVPQSEAIAETSEDAPNDPGVTENVKPPKGAYIEDLTQPAAERITDQGPVRQAHPFSDEFTGVGGRYVVDPETGERQEVYEKYTDSDGSTKHRKAA